MIRERTGRGKWNGKILRRTSGVTGWDRGTALVGRRQPFEKTRTKLQHWRERAVRYLAKIPLQSLPSLLGWAGYRDTLTSSCMWL